MCWKVGLNSREGKTLFSFRHRIQAGSGAKPAFYPLCIWGYFPGVMRPGREATTSRMPAATIIAFDMRRYGFEINLAQEELWELKLNSPDNI
jgi:hypothetical protein